MLIDVNWYTDCEYLEVTLNDESFKVHGLQYTQTLSTNYDKFKESLTILEKLYYLGRIVGIYSDVILLLPSKLGIEQKLYHSLETLSRDMFGEPAYYKLDIKLLRELEDNSTILLNYLKGEVPYDYVTYNLTIEPTSHELLHLCCNILYNDSISLQSDTLKPIIQSLLLNIKLSI